MSDKICREDEKGIVHLMHPFDSWIALCGDKSDIPYTEKKTVTCKHCCEIIKYCRGVRTKPVRTLQEMEKDF